MGGLLTEVQRTKGAFLVHVDSVIKIECMDTARTGIHGEGEEGLKIRDMYSFV
jgi:hypothetical protein